MSRKCHRGCDVSTALEASELATSFYHWEEVSPGRRYLLPSLLPGVQAFEVRDARYRDVCLARAERPLRRVHEAVHGARLVNGGGAHEHEPELPAEELLDLDSNGGGFRENGHEVPAEVRITGVGVRVVRVHVVNRVEPHERDRDATGLHTIFALRFTPMPPENHYLTGPRARRRRARGTGAGAGRDGRR